MSIEAVLTFANAEQKVVEKYFFVVQMPDRSCLPS